MISLKSGIVVISELTSGCIVCGAVESFPTISFAVCMFFTLFDASKPARQTAMATRQQAMIFVKCRIARVYFLEDFSINGCVNFLDFSISERRQKVVMEACPPLAAETPFETVMRFAKSCDSFQWRRRFPPVLADLRGYLHPQLNQEYRRRLEHCVVIDVTVAFP